MSRGIDRVTHTTWIVRKRGLKPTRKAHHVKLATVSWHVAKHAYYELNHWQGYHATLLHSLWPADFRSSGAKDARRYMNTKGAPRKVLSTLHPNTILKPNLDSNAQPQRYSYS